jgi:hypothetical protein
VFLEPADQGLRLSAAPDDEDGAIDVSDAASA